MQTKSIMYRNTHHKHAITEEIKLNLFYDSIQSNSIKVHTIVYKDILQRYAISIHQ